MVKITISKEIKTVFMQEDIVYREICLLAIWNFLEEWAPQIWVKNQFKPIFYFYRDPGVRKLK